jgi:hypothetical protein
VEKYFKGNKNIGCFPMGNKEVKPPKTAISFLRYLADPEDVLSLIGDVEEEYKDIHSQKGSCRADLWIWTQVLISLYFFLKPFIFRSFSMKKIILKSLSVICAGRL